MQGTVGLVIGDWRLDRGLRPGVSKVGVGVRGYRFWGQVLGLHIERVIGDGGRGDRFNTEFSVIRFRTKLADR